MARHKITIGLSPLVASVVAGSGGGATTERILDAAAELLAAYGLKRWTVEDVADRAGIGRTSVYRAFAARDDILYAVLARELRQTLAAVQASAARERGLENQVVEGAVTALMALRGSLVDKLLRSDPATLLPFLTTGAGPLVGLTREVIVGHARSTGLALDEQEAAEVGEVAARLGLSFVLTRDTIFPVDDVDSLRRSLHRLLRPLLSPLVKPRRRAG
jgi:TetR/AcrR family transcriptional repressor of uid operon